MEKNIEKLLEEIYFTPSNPGSFGGASKLQYELKKQKGISQPEKKLNDWLSSIDAYTIHKKINRKIKYQKILSAGIDDQWQADLVVIPDYAPENDNYKNLLTCIDVFSKFAWIIPLKTKKQEMKLY